MILKSTVPSLFSNPKASAWIHGAARLRCFVVTMARCVLGSSALCAFLFLAACSDEGASAGATGRTESSIPDERLALLSGKYCSACHLPPPPDAFTSESWASLFQLMRGWIEEKKMPFDEAEYAELLALFETNAPEKFILPKDEFDFGPFQFGRAEIGLSSTVDRPKITHVNVTDLDGDGKSDALICDGVTNRVTWLRIQDGSWEEIFIADIRRPVRTHVFDFNGDGHQDIVVASIGTINPSDEPIGSVWLLENQGDMSFKARLLLSEVPRVSDVKTGDFNGDGKIDFIITAFGWRESGEVILLEQVHPSLFVPHRLVQKNGPMQVEVTDLDQDGHLDFLVLYAQQHESIEWFRNDGKGGFESKVLWRAPHPAFGSSSFRLVDLDGDGDLDILHTNGDMMDEVSLAKPYHGVRWLENRGNEFHPHELFSMAGCYNAVPYDMDGDDDLDIVVTSLYYDWAIDDYPSVVWLENQGDGKFHPHAISYTPTNLPAMDVGDLNHDGLPDIIVGGMHLVGPLGRHGRITVFFRQP